MRNQVLSIKQMQELKELGIDTSKASMCWFIGATPDLLPIYSPIEYVENEYIPTFTLYDILEMLPKEIIKDGISYIKCLDAYYDERYLFLYINRDIQDILHEECDIPLEAAFNMLKWCKQNNYI